MRIELKNIGMIKSANIDLPGLTVIAGVNDVGKSTVGKVLFAIVWALNHYIEDFERERSMVLNDKFLELYSGLRKFINFEEDVDLRNALHPKILFSSLKSKIRSNDFLKNDIDENIDPILKNYIQIIENQNMPQKAKTKLFLIIDDIRAIYDIEKDSFEMLKRSISKAFKSEFDGQISSLHNEDVGEVRCAEGDNLLFNVLINAQEIQQVNYVDNIFLKDVSYIESPLILQIQNLVTNSLAGFTWVDRAPQHMKDLSVKLINAKNLQNDRYFSDDLVVMDKEYPIGRSIGNIIQGNIAYIQDVENFIFKKSNHHGEINVSSHNISSGIKSMGILQMLYNSGFLTSRSLLIIDEPEVHLHPEWQIEYAKIVIELVKMNIPVLINTHSPYMLQALSYYVEREDCKDVTKFYLADIEEGDTGSTFEDVTDHLSKVFQKLSEPLQRLVWYDYGAE